MSSSPYAPAAKLLNQIWTQRKGLKTLSYNRKGELICSAKTYAICAHVLQYKPIIEEILEEVELKAKNEGLLFVLLYELLLGPNQSIKGGGALKRQVMKEESKLRKILDRIKEERPESIPPLSGNSNSNSQTMTIPRYVRVNIRKANAKDVIAVMKNKGLTEIFLDPHVPDLLVLPPTADTRGKLQDLVQQNKIVLQDKSSCFSALCLVYGFDRMMSSSSKKPVSYLDACAAPGNKTSHLASLVEKDSIIHALDKSKDRYKLLKRRMEELVGTAVQCHALDFLQVTPNEINADIHAILLDPSCSGSGMSTNHHQVASLDVDYTSDRVQKLSEFQFQALRHATTAFPNVERVVYSTCSLYKEENEKVVQKFLQDEASAGWELVSPKCLQSWPRRGIPSPDGLTEEQSKSLIRVHPQLDGTNGFFVACFERKSKVAKSNPKNKWIDICSTDGISLYNNEFHSQEHGKLAQVEVPEESSKGPGEKSTGQETSKPLKKTRQSVSKKVESSKAIPKKIAKKLEWKRKQSERKAKRMALKQSKA